MSTERERAILTAAEELFADRGFHAVGVDAVGTLAGIGGSAIYRSFASKDDILATLFDEASAELMKRLGPVAADPDEELANLVDAHLNFTLERHRLALIWLYEQRSLTSVHREAFLRRREEYLQRWLSALGAAFPAAQHVQLVAAMNAAQAALMSVALHPNRRDTETVRNVVRTQVLDGFAAIATLTVLT